MKTEIPIEQLLRWRLAQAEAEAPPAPCAAHLLEMARPWWETRPEQFQALVERLGRMPMVHDQAMADPPHARSGHPVPALIVRAVEEWETAARVLYLKVRDVRLCLRFELVTPPGQAETDYDVTVVSEADARPLFSAHACLSEDGEYRLDAELAEDIASRWGLLKVTDRLPFGLILHPIRTWNDKRRKSL